MKHIKKIVLSFLILSMFTLALPMRALAEESLVISGNPLASKNGYTDIAGTWSEKWVGTYGYTDIFSSGDGLFHPNQPITRMEFARLLHEALAININYFAATDIGEYYKDVKNSDAGAGALYDLVSLGIIDTKDSFRPSAALDRDEMVHYIMNAFYHFAGDKYALPAIYVMPFTDADGIKSGYDNGIVQAVLLKLVNGRGGNLFCPREAATRAEAVTITGKLAELLKTYENDVSVKAAATKENGGLRLTLTVSNNSGKAITIDHSSQQLFDFKVFDKNGETLYCWSASRMFAQVVTTTKIAPGEKIVFSGLVDSTTYGTFKANMKTAVGYITGSSKDFTIDTNGYFAAVPAA